jgi:glycosyltransferase involved in cell wall biosynthesis
MTYPVYISIVIPTFNESSSLDELVGRISEVINKIGFQESFEIIFVDDGSTDNTRELLQKLISNFKYVRAVLLWRNCGKSLALMAGFRSARGELIFTMDGDLQDNPEDMPILYEKIQGGYDVVCAWRNKRQDTLTRRIGSKLFNMVVAKLTGLRIHDVNCGFKLYRQRVIKDIIVYGQYHRFIPVLAHFLRFRVCEVHVSNSVRRYGASKFNTFRYQGFFDLLSLLFTYRYSLVPLHFFGLISILFIILLLVLTYFLCENSIIFDFPYDFAYFFRNSCTIRIIL